MANGHKINARVRMRAKMVAHCRSQEKNILIRQKCPKPTLLFDKNAYLCGWKCLLMEKYGKRKYDTTHTGNRNWYI